MKGIGNGETFSFNRNGNRNVDHRTSIVSNGSLPDHSMRNFTLHETHYPQARGPSFCSFSLRRMYPDILKEISIDAVPLFVSEALQRFADIHRSSRSRQIQIERQRVRNRGSRAWRPAPPASKNPSRLQIRP